MSKIPNIITSSYILLYKFFLNPFNIKNLLNFICERSIGSLLFKANTLAFHTGFQTKKPYTWFLNTIMVTGTGFGPVNACVKGMCVKPLHQPAKNGGPEWT